jgi:serine/threonine protein kinase
MLAVEYMHSFETPIIHRDLKPENILIDKNGYVKVTDFGWSNYYNRDTAIPRTTVCGTLEYLPPEMVSEQGHHPSADVWCLGVLLFEMLVGYTPFKSQDRDRMLENIAAARPKFPLSFPRKAKELVCKILKKNPMERITIE